MLCEKEGVTWVSHMTGDLRLRGGNAGKAEGNLTLTLPLKSLRQESNETRLYQNFEGYVVEVSRK